MKTFCILCTCLQLSEYRWAIGSSQNLTDIQPFTSVGTGQFAANLSLSGLLENKKTYYVHVEALNEAGLKTVAVSDGEKIYFALLDYRHKI